MSIIIVGVIAFFAYLIAISIKNKKAPIESSAATLIGKDIDKYVDSNQMLNQTYILSFDINGETKRFTVDDSVYNQYEEGQECKICYKGNKFIGFVDDDF